MDAALDFLLGQSDGDPTLVMSVLVFLAATTLAFGIMATVRVRQSVKRRSDGIAKGSVEAASAGDQRSLRKAGRSATQQVVAYASKHYSETDSGATRELRRRLIQAGILDPRAVALFFLARAAAAMVFAGLGLVLAPIVDGDYGSTFWLLVLFAGIIGYFVPTIYLKRRIASRQAEHRAGFPDFMDLLVVCAEAGLSMDAALDRVGRELTDSYRSLSLNIYMTTLEIRAGRTLSEALEHFGDRVGLDEARSFATLLQQSEALGSSLTQALRIYSDDMRHLRLSRAEEKAHALPAKLSVPLTMCVFPVVIVVIMLPVYVRFKYGP